MRRRQSADIGRSTVRMRGRSLRGRSFWNPESASCRVVRRHFVSLRPLPGKSFSTCRARTLFCATHAPQTQPHTHCTPNTFLFRWYRSCFSGRPLQLSLSCAAAVGCSLQPTRCHFLPKRPTAVSAVSFPCTWGGSGVLGETVGGGLGLAAWHERDNGVTKPAQSADGVLPSGGSIGGQPRTARASAIDR